jgi:hypothetical protein
MKTLQITSKAKAVKLQVESLFTPVNGGTLNAVKYSGGKYKPSSFPVGREVEVNDNVHAIWSESRRDGDGAYCSLYCMASK